jgi:GH25 family lysozyme M1 (1,4-beta-N-acetylmuramidase)
MPQGRDWTFWQYDFWGHVAGVPAQVDLDVFKGDARMLADLMKR